MRLPLVEALLHQSYPANVRQLERLLLLSLYGSQGAELERVEGIPKASGARPATEDLSPDQIEAALVAQDWNVSSAARDLGLSRFQLLRRMKRLGLDRPGAEGK